jgi:hypothetical protein
MLRLVSPGSGTSRASRDVRLKSAKWANADIDQVAILCTLAPGSFTQQGRQRAAQQSAKGASDSLPIASVWVESFEADQQVKRLSIAFDVITCCPASLARPTTPDIVGAPLLKGGSLLNHRISRSASVPTQVGKVSLPSRATRSPLFVERGISRLATAVSSVRPWLQPDAQGPF